MNDARTGAEAEGTKTVPTTTAVEQDHGARRLRRVRWIAAPVLLVLLLGVWGRLLLTDAPLPEDGDLVYVPIPVPPEAENGWILFRANGGAAAGVDISQWFRTQPASPLIDARALEFDPSKRADWPSSATATAARELLRTHDADFAFIDEMLARPRSVIPLESGGIPPGSDMLALRGIARWLEFRSSVAAMEGRIDDAVDDDLRRAALGSMFRRVENGSLVQRAMGAAIEKAALTALLARLEEPPYDEARLIRIAAALLAPPGREDALESALRLEYSWLRSVILEAPGTVAYKPHRTLAIVAERRRAQIRELGLPYAEREGMPRPENPGPWVRLVAALSGNANGALIAQLDPNLESMIESHDAALFVRRAAAVAIALMRHRLRTGELPATLDPLVPDLLPALPVDPFTHGPIRYDPARGLLWSPGADGIDGGGRTGQVVEPDADEPTVRVPRP